MPEITIHPRVCEQALKMLRYRYGDDDEIIVRVLKALRVSDETKEKLNQINLYRTAQSVKIKNNADGSTPEKFVTVEKVVSDIKPEDLLVIFRDLLIDSEVKRWRGSNWNVYFDPIKSWRDRLLKYLQENGILFDEDSEVFQYIDSSTIKIGQPFSSAPFMQINFNDNFFNNLEKEINGCYQNGFYTASLILSRKLVENLLIDLLKKKYPLNTKQNLDLYYISTQGRHRDLSDLIGVLDTKKSDFPTYSQPIEEILKLVTPFRETSNANTHSILISSRKEEVDGFNVPRLIDLLKYVYDRM